MASPEEMAKLKGEEFKKQAQQGAENLKAKNLQNPML